MTLNRKKTLELTFPLSSGGVFRAEMPFRVTRSDFERIKALIHLLEGTLDFADQAAGVRADKTIGLVRSAVESLPVGQFSTREIQEMLNSQCCGVLNRTTISSSLKRMAASNEIRLVKTGSGRGPSVYERVEGRVCDAD